MQEPSLPAQGAPSPKGWLVGWLVFPPTHTTCQWAGETFCLLADDSYTVVRLVPGHFSPGASMPCMPFQATCWDGDAGAHRKTRPSMQPSAPLARVWVGGGVFKVGSSCWRPRLINCGCHFLENRKARSVITIMTSKVVCVLCPAGVVCLPACLCTLACCAGRGPNWRKERGAGRGTRAR